MCVLCIVCEFTEKSARVYVQILETNAHSPSPSLSLFFETGFLPEPVALHFCLTVWPGNPQDSLPPHPNTGVTHIPHHTRLGALQPVSQVNNQDLLLWCPKHLKCLLCPCSPQQGHLQLEPTINSPISFLAWPNTLFKHMELTTMTSGPSGFESGPTQL